MHFPAFYFPILKNTPLSDPDLTGGDGVYSRYLTTYPGPGRYSFTVTADDDDGQAFTVQTGRGGRSMAPPLDADAHTVSAGLQCCGSRVQVPQDLRFLTGTFRRVGARSPVLHVGDVVALTGSSDVMPPSRIGDFRLAPDESGKR